MFLQAPLSVQQTWPSSTMSDATKIHESSIAIVELFAVLTTVAYIFKISTNIISRSFHVYDGLLLCVFITFIAYVTTSFAAIGFGFGLHTWDIVPYPSWIGPMFKLAFAQNLCFIVSNTLLKLSFLSYYKKNLTTESSKVFVHLVHASMSIVTICGVVGFVTAIVQCMPIDAYWHAQNPESAHCTTFSMYWVGIANIVTDFIILVLPCQALWAKVTNRISVAVLYVFGLMSMIFGAVRLIPIVKATKEYDYSGQAIPLMVWSALEISMGLFCIYAPAIRNLIVTTIETRREKRKSLNSDKLTRRPKRASREPEMNMYLEDADAKEWTTAEIEYGARASSPSEIV